MPQLQVVHRLLTWQFAEENHLLKQFLTIRFRLFFLASTQSCFQKQVTERSLQRLKDVTSLQVICNFTDCW